jgi:hypothetical protein
MDNLALWNAIKRPPKEALKTIRGGRLNGMTDISPQWRYEELTRQFGPCGVGWKFEIIDLWITEGEGFVQVANAKVHLYIKFNDKWSEPIPGVGGSMFVAKEKAGPYTSDESYKMAVTDAVSTAAKLLGLAADIYKGQWDGSKYKDEPKVQTKSVQTPKQQLFTAMGKEKLNEADMIDLVNFVKATENIKELPNAKMLDMAKKIKAYINEWREAKQAA